MYNYYRVLWNIQKRAKKYKTIKRCGSLPPLLHRQKETGLVKIIAIYLRELRTLNWIYNHRLNIYVYLIYDITYKTLYSVQWLPSSIIFGTLQSESVSRPQRHLDVKVLVWYFNHRIFYVSMIIYDNILYFLNCQFVIWIIVKNI